MRRCFLAPIPDIDACADLLSAAADAILSNDLAMAKTLVLKADMPAICEYTLRIIGSIDPEIHFQSLNPPQTTIAKVARRMPPRRVEQSIYLRDGWRCRYCASRVISRKARSRLNFFLPVEARWGRSNRARHCGLFLLSASLDHVLPHSRGGSNQEENLVTACTACQFGRNQWTLEEVGFEDPRHFPPIRDSWDGLCRLLAKAK